MYQVRRMKISPFYSGPNINENVVHERVGAINLFFKYNKEIYMPYISCFRVFGAVQGKAWLARFRQDGTKKNTINTFTVDRKKVQSIEFNRRGSIIGLRQTNFVSKSMHGFFICLTVEYRQQPIIGKLKCFTSSFYMQFL